METEIWPKSEVGTKTVVGIETDAWKETGAAIGTDVGTRSGGGIETVVVA